MNHKKTHIFLIVLFFVSLVSLSLLYIFFKVFTDIRVQPYFPIIFFISILIAKPVFYFSLSSLLTIFVLRRTKFIVPSTLKIIAFIATVLGAIFYLLILSWSIWSISHDFQFHPIPLSVITHPQCFLLSGILLSLSLPLKGSRKI